MTVSQYASGAEKMCFNRFSFGYEENITEIIKKEKKLTQFHQNLKIDLLQKNVQTFTSQNNECTFLEFKEDNPMKDAKNLILIVEDDEKLLKSLEDFFIANKFSVLTAMDGQEAVELYFANNHQIDLILLDGMLPGLDGYDVLKAIREYSDVPVIMITARESEEEHLKGLECGADNYITKPFRFRILKAYVDILLKRKNKDVTGVVLCGKLRIEQSTHRVFLKNEVLDLTPKEYALLVYFTQNRNVVLTREVILDAVWGFDYSGDTRTVDTLVKQLRKKLTEECSYIHSIYGVGYRFEVAADE